MTELNKMASSANTIVGGSTFTQEQIDNRTSDYICFDCGLQFLTEEQKKRENITTAHKAKCGLCQQEKTVIHFRHWNYLHAWEICKPFKTNIQG